MQPDPTSLLPLTPLWFNILLSLVDQPKHGYAIINQIEQRTEGAMSPATGTVYLALQRLAEEGLVRALPAEKTSSKRPRKFYELTSFGRAVAVAEADRIIKQASRAAEVLALPHDRNTPTK